MKCTHVCAAQKADQLVTKLYLKPDFPSSADELAEPRPDMNIKVAAFTVSEKSIYKSKGLALLQLVQISDMAIESNDNVKLV